MQTMEIPKSEWRSFFDQFSRMHHGQPVVVETLGTDVGVEANVEGIPLLGVTAEPAGGGGGAPRIDLIAGRPDGIDWRHAIADPVRVRASEWNDGISAVVEIESADGHTTLLRV